MTAARIVVTGGSGFVGRTLCAHLMDRGDAARVIVPTRRRSRAQALAVLPRVDVVEADVHDPAAMTGVLAGADALVQLVAILNGNAAAFERVHVALPRALARACAAAGVRRVVHVSALGVAADAPSRYLRSKAAGEAVWRDSGLEVTIVRPSVIFGAGDRFTNVFAALLRALPVLPLASARARFQPVWVGDVAGAIAAALTRPDLAGRAIECAGPEVLTLRQIVERVGAMAGCARPVLALPEPIAAVQAALMALLPGEPVLTRDNLRSMRVPNVASGRLPGLRELGIDPAPLDILAGHLAPPGR